LEQTKHWQNKSMSQSAQFVPNAAQSESESKGDSDGAGAQWLCRGGSSPFSASADIANMT
jgi:hypothetical protein